jgi:hypothetical protein
MKKIICVIFYIFNLHIISLYARSSTLPLRYRVPHPHGPLLLVPYYGTVPTLRYYHAVLRSKNDYFPDPDPTFLKIIILHLSRAVHKSFPQKFTFPFGLH